jgi:hypothetical protein
MPRRAQPGGASAFLGIAAPPAICQLQWTGEYRRFQRASECWWADIGWSGSWCSNVCCLHLVEMTQESATKGGLHSPQLRRVLPQLLGPFVANGAGMLKPASATLLTLPLLFAACGLDAENSNQSTRAVITRKMAVGARPESVTRAWGDKLYVSLQGPTNGPGDGEVRVIVNGAAEPFVDGLDEPKGLAFVGGHLVVTDLTRVWIIDEAGGKRVLADASAFPSPIAFLNDAAPDRGGQAVFVTEMGGRTKIRDEAGLLLPIDSPLVADIPVTSQIFRVSLDGVVTVAASPSPETLIVNGVAVGYMGDRLLAADFFYGNVTEIKLDGDEKRVIATGFRGADGIEQDSKGNIFVSSFEQGTVWRMDGNGGDLKVLVTGFAPKSTADFYLNDKNSELVVPSTVDGTLTFITTTN